jgi:hypothetical protein
MYQLAIGYAMPAHAHSAGGRVVRVCTEKNAVAGHAAGVSARAGVFAKKLGGEKASGSTGFVIYDFVAQYTYYHFYYYYSDLADARPSAFYVFETGNVKKVTATMSVG